MCERGSRGEPDLISCGLPGRWGLSLGEERLARPGDFGRSSSSGSDHPSLLSEAPR